jgi:HK97 family phage major capsid protein
MTNAERLKRAKELRTEKRGLVLEIRKLVDAAEGEKRSLRAEEEEKVDKYERAIEDLEKRIGSLERAAEGSEEEEGEEEGEEEREQDGKSKPPEDDEQEEEESQRSVKMINGKAYVLVGKGKQKRAELRGADGRLLQMPGEDDASFAKRQRRSRPEYRDAFLRYVLSGERALHQHMNGQRRDVQADIDFVGGFLTMPQQFVNQLLKFTDNLLFIRQLATKFTLPNAQSLGAPALDTDPDDADWTSELATGNEDEAMRFGKRELVPFPLAKRLKASNKLLRMASVSSTFSAYDNASGTGPIENFLISRLGYKLAVPQEKGFLTGNGVNQPLGVFTASNRGISTARDISTGSTTGITGDGLIAAKYNLKQQYHKAARWLFSRAAIRRIRQLKDSYGQYLWQPGLQAGAPDMLLECPLMMSEYVPSTFTDTSYVGLLADFSFYWIADSIEYQIQKLVELYAEQNQTGFIVRAEVDGMPVLEEAFTRLQCGA